MKELRDDLLPASDSMSFDEFLKETFTAVVFDEASQTNTVKMSLFLHLFPIFDGIIVIYGEPKKQNTFFVCNSGPARESLSKSMLSCFVDSKEGTKTILF